MTQRELEDKVFVRLANGYNSYKVEIKYRGKKYYCTSNNSIAWDSLRESDTPNPMTMKQALQEFYNECKSENDLN